MATELYLVTGFLGAGKTTFIKNFIRMFEGRNVQLIVNDFGQEGVDGTLLSELGVEMDEIDGGSVFCSCRIDQFEKALDVFVEEDSDVVIVEASGLADPTGVRRMFEQSKRYERIEYKGAICLIDAVRFDKIYAKARMAVKQLASSDVVVINKVDKATPEQLENVRELVRGQRPDIPVVETSFGVTEDTILETLANSYHADDAEMPLTADLTSRELLVTVKPSITPKTLKMFIQSFSDQTYRVKGFIQTTEGLMLADCVGNVVDVEPFEGKVPEDRIGKLTVLSGQKMRAYKYVKEACATYADDVEGFVRV